MVAAFILAGGESSRMGREKSALRLNRRTLIAIMREKARAVADEVRVVGPRARLGAEAIEDVFAGRGPLAGIHAALRASPAELNLVLAVDLPFLERAFLKYLVQQAQRSPALVTVPRTARGWQPLCAVYRAGFAETAERALAAGRNKIDALFSEVGLRVIEEEELRAAGFSEKMFRNLNTPEDFEAARAAMTKASFPRRRARARRH